MKMQQFTVQFGTFGSNVSNQINRALARNPGWKLTNLFNIEVHRIGGSDRNVIAVFESDADVVPYSFRD